MIICLTLVPQTALAHVAVSPGAAGPDELVTFVFTIPNESSSEDTVRVDLQLPRDFDLKGVPAAAGWDVSIDPASSRPRFVHWEGGSIPPARIAMFRLRGRTPDGVRLLRFPITQQLERTTVSWTGPSASEYPAAVVSIGDHAGADDADALPPVPLASPPAPSVVAATDESAALARSRSSLAVSLSVAGLLAGLGALAISLGRRRSPPGGSPVQATTPAARTARRITAKSSTKPLRNPAQGASAATKTREAIVPERRG